MAEVVGVSEIAERLGVGRSTVDVWRFHRRVGFPDPTGSVNGQPAWSWPDVEAWAVQRPAHADEPIEGGYDRW